MKKQSQSHDPDINNFYRDLKPFDKFIQIADLESYTPVPDGWTVMITDIENSTQAIEQGNYKAVNMMGAASITAILNKSRAKDIPFVFGGDGAAIAVPPNLSESAKNALLGVSDLAKRKFGLNLRVGGVPVADLRARGKDLTVSKFELSPGNHLAMFAGGGLVLADRLVKDDKGSNPYLFPVLQRQEADLEGLSCRWDPLTPRNGQMLSMMIQPLSDNYDDHKRILAGILQCLSKILQGDPESSAPANEHSMYYRWPPKGLWMEAKSQSSSGTGIGKYCAILLESFIQKWCEIFDKKAGPYNAPVYRQELRSNTDFQKYDDILRMVLDVSPEQAKSICGMLGKLYRDGHILYGTHLSQQALMTCLVFSLENSEHVHFVDGADGGFAMAAKMFKMLLENREL